MAAGDPKALEVHEIVEALKRDAVDRGLLTAQGVYRWYRARAAGDAVVLFDAAGREAARFDFPRQRDGERLCLSDYVRDDADDYRRALRGHLRRRRARARFSVEGARRVRALACAPGAGHRVCGGVRRDAPFPDADALGVSGPAGAADQREAESALSGNPRVVRVSGLSESGDQATLFGLLEPETIGLTLTEGLHDGSGGLGVGAGVPSRRGEVLQGRLRNREPERSAPLTKARARAGDPARARAGRARSFRSGQSFVSSPSSATSAALCPSNRISIRTVAMPRDFSLYFTRNGCASLPR